MEAVVEATTTRVEAIASRLQAIASRLEAIATRVEAIKVGSYESMRLGLEVPKALSFDFTKT